MGTFTRRLHRLKKLSDKPPHERTPDGVMRNPLPKEVIEKTREVAHEKDQSDKSEEDEEETHNKRQRIRKPARRHVDNHTLANTNAVKPKRETPRLSDLKRALRWLRAQYQRRAEEAA